MPDKKSEAAAPAQPVPPTGPEVKRSSRTTWQEGKEYSERVHNDLCEKCLTQAHLGPCPAAPSPVLTQPSAERPLFGNKIREAISQLSSVGRVPASYTGEEGSNPSVGSNSAEAECPVLPVCSACDGVHVGDNLIHWATMGDESAGMCWEEDHYPPDGTFKIDVNINAVTCAKCLQHYITLNDLTLASSPAVAPADESYEILKVAVEKFVEQETSYEQRGYIVLDSLREALDAANKQAAISGERAKSHTSALATSNGQELASPAVAGRTQGDVVPLLSTPEEHLEFEEYAKNNFFDLSTRKISTGDWVWNSPETIRAFYVWRAAKYKYRAALRESASEAPSK